MLAYYLHNLSPEIIKFSDSLKIHWYGLAYVLGFYCCYLVMVHLAKKGFGSLKSTEVGDFITFAALFGVVLGGRLGYMLFYNFDGLLKNPLSTFRLWDGGMSSHGGIAGLALFSLWYSWRHKISWTGIGDNLVVGSPLGILFGRMANFINGELYGRATTSTWLGMKFPTELVQEDSMRQIAPSNLGLTIAGDVFPRHSDEIVALAKTTPDGLAKLEEILTLRHPSQLYEGALEGLFLFLVLYFVRTKFKKLPDGVVTGLFFIIYAVCRISVENLRQPDSDLIMGITKGQFYSIFMILIGVAFMVYGFKWGKRSTPPQAA